MIRISILGCTGHIGRNLTARFCGVDGCELYLFSRNPDRARELCQHLRPRGQVAYVPYSDFSDYSYDAIINCVGIADPARIAGAGQELFRTGEHYDNLVLAYLDQHDARYVNMSSGAAYGSDFSEPASDARLAYYHINPIQADEYYGLTKLYCEAKHRARLDRHIVDLRVFGFFSRYIDLQGRFLLSEAARCILNGETMIAEGADIVRDFAHPDDLFQLVTLCLEGGQRNEALDVYSRAPVTKFQLLDMLRDEFGLEYRIASDAKVTVATGMKSQYYSTMRRAANLGYQPRYSSLEAVRSEMRMLVGAEGPGRRGP